MAVTIELDVDASGATGKIGAVASSLKGLEMMADDMDIDLDADIGDITEEIDNFSEALSNLDVDMNNLTRDLNEAVEKLDGAEIGVNVNTPDGNTGGGDSTGSDPPGVVDFSTFGDNVNTGTAATDGGKGGESSIQDLVRKIEKAGDFSPGDVQMFRTTSDDMNTLSKEFYHNVQGNEHPTRNFDIPGDDGSGVSFGADTGFGTEGISMQARRQKYFSDSEIAEMKSLGTGSEKSAFKGLFGDVEMSDLKKAKKQVGGFGSKLSKLKPTMGKYMQVLAALIPLAVVLGTQLLGVAAAMGSVAAAGGAIMGLGLLGHADSMAGSVAEAKQELRSLKNELFETFQPTMQQFAPIQSEMFDAIPDGLEPVAEKMEGLTGFKSLLFDLGAALSGGMVEALDIIERNEAAIKQLTKRFAGIIGSGLLNFFEFLIQSAARNQDLLVSFGNALVKLVVTFYNVSLAITKILNVFSPLAGMLAWVSNLLNNKFILAMLAAVSVAYITAAAFSKMGLAAMMAFSRIGLLGSGSMLKSLVSGLTMIQGKIAALIAKYTALSAAASMARAAIAMTGIGLLAVGAGAVAAGSVLSGPNKSDPSGGYRGGQKRVYHDNRSYTIDNSGGDDSYAEQKRMEKTIKDVNGANRAQSRPTVETNSIESDGESRTDKK